MNIMGHSGVLQALHRLGRTCWSSVIAALAVGVLAGVVGGCALSPGVSTTSDRSMQVGAVFPSALMVEPVQLRAGNIYTTQLFQIKDIRERWIVALGFLRTDQKLTTQQRMEGKSNTCWTDSPGKPIRLKTCENVSPGFHLRWELLQEDGVVVAQYSFDSLTASRGGTYAADTITSTLSGFSSQKPGFYKLRIAVLRDSKELDFLSPHIVIDRPFFSSRSIE
ncbi:hypothetical protein ABL840_21945 [Variovorax sp. NFACC27]|uniref:hypothetical protein n=1 Tax=unclassified Variovorax TaxID=663243 RepID=UPI00115F8AD9